MKFFFVPIIFFVWMCAHLFYLCDAPDFHKRAFSCHIAHSSFAKWLLLGNLITVAHKEGRFLQRYFQKKEVDLVKKSPESYETIEKITDKLKNSIISSDDSSTCEESRPSRKRNFNSCPKIKQVKKEADEVKKAVNAAEDEDEDYEFNFEFIFKNCIIQDNGQVFPKKEPSDQFIKCFMYRLKNGHPSPFKLNQKFFNFITTGKGLVDYKKNSYWTPLSIPPRGINSASLFKLKLKRPVQFLLDKQSLENMKYVRNTLLELSELNLARLQSLLTLSASLLPADSFERRNARLIRIRVDNKLDKCIVTKGWLYIPQFEDADKLKFDISNFLTDNVTDKFSSRTSLSIEGIIGDSPKISPNVVKKKKVKEVEKVVKVSVAPPAPEITLKSCNDALFMISNFEKYVNQVTPENFRSMISVLYSILQSDDVEFVAFDCEMTSLYTQEDEDEFRIIRNGQAPTMPEKSSIQKIIDGVEAHNIFQLGLVIKMRSGDWSILNFYTAPVLEREHFTKGTLKFLFTDPLSKKHPGVDVNYLIDKEIEDIRTVSIDPDSQLREVVHLIFASKAPIVTFSGYVDFLHLFKATGIDFNLNHFEVKEKLQHDLKREFWDVKFYIVSPISPVEKPSLVNLIKHHGIVQVADDKLHNAAFDALLTAALHEFYTTKLGVVLVPNILYQVF